MAASTANICLMRPGFLVYSLSKFQAAARFMEAFLCSAATACKPGVGAARITSFFRMVPAIGSAESSPGMVAAAKGGDNRAEDFHPRSRLVRVLSGAHRSLILFFRL